MFKNKKTVLQVKLFFKLSFSLIRKNTISTEHFLYKNQCGYTLYTVFQTHTCGESW